MGRVGVLRKQDEGLGVGMDASGGVNVLLPTAGREKIDYDKRWGTGKIGQMAQAGGKLGRYGRLGAGALGAFHRFYDATSSGQPGVLGATAGGAYTGYAGSQGLENWAAERGAALGARNERRGEKVAVKNAADARQRQEGMANYTQGAAPTHTSAGGKGMTRDYPHGPYSPVAKPTFDGSMFDAPAPPPNIPSSPSLDRRIAGKRAERAAANPPMSVADANATLASGKNPIHTQGYPGFNSRMFNAEYKQPDPTLGTDPLGGLGESMSDAGITSNNPPPPQTTQTNLGHYPTNNKVAVLDAEKLRALENDGVDASGNKVSGTAEVQG